MKIGHFDVDASISQYLNDDRHTEPAHLYMKSNDYDCITIKSSTKISEPVLLSFPELKLVITRTVGVDHIDLKACKKHGISVYHIVDYGSFNIAEHAMALLLAGARNVVSSQKEIKKGVFSYKNLLGFSLKNKVLGVIGTGRIGLEFVKRAKAFEMQIIAYDVYKNEKAAKELGYAYVDLDTLLSRADIISLHAPLLPETKHLINKEALSKMKNGVILINTARGELIDTDELVKHVGKFRFIGLDVLENESYFSKNHPLLQHDNVLITPHISFFSDASVKKIAEETYKCIENYKKNINDGKIV